MDQQPDWRINWKSPQFRGKCVQEMEKVLLNNPNAQISAKELESRIFQKAITKEEYVNYVKACLTKVSLVNPNRVHYSAPDTGAAQPNVQSQMHSGTNTQRQPPQTAAPPAQITVGNKRKQPTVDPDYVLRCPVCLETDKKLTDKQLTTPPCGHLLCKPCASSLKSLVCPVCRKKFKQSSLRLLYP